MHAYHRVEEEEECGAGPHEMAWKLANDVRRTRDHSAIPAMLRGVLGCGLATSETEGKTDRGKIRLYRILVSETADLIWKLRNERRIRDSEGSVQPDDEVRNRWAHAINKRLTLDRRPRNTARFKKTEIEVKLVKATWSSYLTGEEDLPANWPTAKGFLVGISVVRPRTCFFLMFSFSKTGRERSPMYRVLATTPEKKRKPMIQVQIPSMIA